MNDKYRDIDNLLGSLFPSATLKELFEQKTQALGVSLTVAANILGVQVRALNGILNGTQKIIDITILSKISNFLQAPREQIVSLYMQEVERHFPTVNISANKVEFIKENFDLAVLRKAKWIDNITDFGHIEKRLVARLGLRSILEYRKPAVDVAFCVGPFEPKNGLTRAAWLKAVQACFDEIDNPYSFNREELIKIFPRLRWFTMNEKRGLPEVIGLLHRVGVTVVLQQSLPTLQLRGATFNHNGKPCIALTDYVGFYPTLWFALFHELFHVLFDWEEIKENQYHVTDEGNTQLSVQERESEANTFASEYLFSADKVESVKRHLGDAVFVNQVAADNHVHPSIVYTQCAYAMPKSRSAWALARKNSPLASECIENYGAMIEGGERVEDLMHQLKKDIYI